LAQLVDEYLDKIDILKIKIGNDANKILESIDLDELLKNPELYLQELGRAFLNEHRDEIKEAFSEGKKYAEKVVKNET
jgi:hypothetical protein|tara:strand:- start:1216 stop:1449 length:234 start_codon:yes stop_codon:yes gene_type:complete